MTKQEEIERQEKFIAIDKKTIAHYERLIVEAHRGTNTENIEDIIDKANYIKETSSIIYQTRESIRNCERIIHMLKKLD